MNRLCTKKRAWKGLLISTSMVAPMYTDQEKFKFSAAAGFSREILEARMQRKSRRSPKEVYPTRMSQMIYKFFGSKCVGLAQLGMFAAAHAAPDDNSPRKPFQTLNDIFNLSEDSVPEKSRKFARPDPKSSEISDSEEDTDCDEETYFKSRVTKDGVLVLKAEDIAPGRWEALSSYLKENPSVKMLRLQGVEITTKELKIIGASLKEIRHITFCDNSIGLNQGAFDVLCATLLCCTFLESTSIVRNSLRDEHIPQIVDLISKHSSLKQLSLSWNGIGDKGALQLAKALQDMSQAMTLSLRLLDLSYNCIGDLGRHRIISTSKYWRNVYGDPLRICWESQMDISI